MRLRFRQVMLAPAMVLFALFATPASASGIAGCAGAEPIDLAAAVKGRDHSLAHLWGRENVEALPEAAAASGFRVAYPAGSFSPGASGTRGGAGFELRRGGAAEMCLSYKVRFPEGFDFVKGGKLPGLFGGDAPRGCIPENAATGFSARLMWRKDGAGELYLYAPGRDQRCGASIGRGTFSFPPGRWTAVTEKVSIGAPDGRNGRIEVWIDGRLAVRAEGLALGTGPSATVDGLLFATFFGGGDESWASPRDQYADFADFRLGVGSR